VSAQHVRTLSRIRRRRRAELRPELLSHRCPARARWVARAQLRRRRGGLLTGRSCQRRAAALRRGPTLQTQSQPLISFGSTLPSQRACRTLPTLNPSLGGSPPVPDGRDWLLWGTALASALVPSRPLLTYSSESHLELCPRSAARGRGGRRSRWLESRRGRRRCCARRRLRTRSGCLRRARCLPRRTRRRLGCLRRLRLSDQFALP
jgi:hypothetical protein